LSDKVEFFNWTDDVYAWYKIADAYVLSSNYEGWALVIIEAASCGLPIIMTDVGCAGEVIKDRESGLVLPLNNEEKLTEAMSMIIEDKELREKIGENARLISLTLPTKAETLILYKKSWELASKYH
jgi:glycosyltransferase involved in cell wall biosynthesis